VLAHRYKIWGDWGPQIQDGQEDCIKHFTGITVIAKRHVEYPYEVFNEIVCMHLGRILGLPIPIGMVLEHNHLTYYCSGDIAAAGGEFPPADFEHLAINEPRLTCGIALFDGWICNADRHAKNVYYDTDNGDVFLIDHGSAVLHSFGIQHLRQNTNRLVIRAEFAAEVRDFSDFRHWYDLLLRIPEGTIQAVCAEAASVGVGIDEAAEAALLLVKRRADLWKLFRDNSREFPRHQATLFSPFEDYNDPTEYSI
jgi:hypothetical protein